MLSKLKEETNRSEKERMELEQSVKNIEEKAYEMKKIKEQHNR